MYAVTDTTLTHGPKSSKVRMYRGVLERHCLCYHEAKSFWHHQKDITFNSDRRFIQIETT